MSQEKNLKYTPEHEWLDLNTEKGFALVGITDFAQDSLGDLVFIELPKVGSVAKQSDVVASVESVKTTSDIYAPISGTIVAVNNELEKAPEQINQTPYEAWIFKIKIEKEEELTALLSYDTYQQQL